MAEPVHLNNHHRDALDKILQHPTSHNAEWRATTSLLEHVSDSEETNGNKVKYTIDDVTLALTRPSNGKTLDDQQVVDVRNFLTQAGYTG